MEIRDIRIDKFGCWEDIMLMGLPSGPSIIHLDDGGQPVEFSRFLHSALYGFDSAKTAYGGAIVFANNEQALTLDRQKTSGGKDQFRVKQNNEMVAAPERWLKRAQAATPAILADRFFLPTEIRSAKDNFAWLAAQPDLIDTLFQQEETAVHTAQDEQQLAQAELDRERKKAAQNVNHLTTQHDHLLDELVELEAEIQELLSKSVGSEKSLSQNVLAELDEEIRRLQDRIAPLEVALSMASRWSELKSQSEHAFEGDLNLLRRALRQFRQAEDDKGAHQETLRRVGKKKAKRINTEAVRLQKEVNRLLARRDWVCQQFEKITETPSIDSSFEVPDVQVAEQVYRDAETQLQQAKLELQSFTEFHRNDLSAEDAETEDVPSEIAPDSLLRLAPLEEQIEELCRRRKWLVQDHQWLLNRQALSSQTRLWITILFVLSILTVFGTQVVASYWWQLTMAALGLGGIVASFAINAVIEKRATRQLFNSARRLENLDCEIELLEQKLAGELVSEKQQIESQLVVLQDAVTLAEKRLEDASEVYQQCIAASGLASTPIENPVPPALTSWAEDARMILQKCNVSVAGIRSPLDLIDQLDLVSLDTTTSGEPEYITSERELAHSELRRLEKFQRNILQKVDATDVYDLESTIEEANAASKQNKLRQKMQRELKALIDQHDDAEEIREILELYSAHDIQIRIEELQSERTHLEQLRQQSSQKTSQRPNQSSLEAMRSQLAEKQTQQQELSARLEVAQQEFEILPEHASFEPIVVKKPAQIPWLLKSLTKGRFDSLEFESDSATFLLRRPDGAMQALTSAGRDAKKTKSKNNDLMELVWIAVRIRLAMIQHRANAGNVLPLSLVADTLSARDLLTVYSTIEQVARDGLQITLLISSQKLADQLKQSNVDVLRVGLTRLETINDFDSDDDVFDDLVNDDETHAWAA